MLSTKKVKLVCYPRSEDWPNSLGQASIALSSYKLQIILSVLRHWRKAAGTTEKPARFSQIVSKTCLGRNKKDNNNNKKKRTKQNKSHDSGYYYSCSLFCRIIQEENIKFLIGKHRAAVAEKKYRLISAERGQ